LFRRPRFGGIFVRIFCAMVYSTVAAHDGGHYIDQQNIILMIPGRRFDGRTAGAVRPDCALTNLRFCS